VETYDIAVIGLGPAGSTLARLLSGRYSVLAVDKKPETRPGGTNTGPWPGGFSKPCGGLLAPAAQKALAAQGLHPPLELFADPQIFSVRTIDLTNGLSRYYPRSYLNMDRDKFDRWLISLAGNRAKENRKSGTVLVQGAEFLGAERGEKGFTISYTTFPPESPPVRQQAAARFLIGADGAASRVRRLFFPRFRTRTYTAIQEWYEAPAEGLYACLFDPELTDSYTWALSKNGSFILGGAFPQRKAWAAFKKLREKVSACPGFPDLSAASARGSRVEACQVLRPFSFQFYPGGGGVFLAGEAAALVSPSSLEGISSALESGRRLAAVLLRAGTDTTPAALHRAYSRALFPLAARLFVKNLRSPFMYRRLLRFLVMKSGVTALKTWCST
jgi:flavin-dependent dehydrogenase